jgi:hypothetical protein
MNLDAFRANAVTELRFGTARDVSLHLRPLAVFVSNGLTETADRQNALKHTDALVQRGGLTSAADKKCDKAEDCDSNEAVGCEVDHWGGPLQEGGNEKASQGEENGERDSEASAAKPAREADRDDEEDGKHEERPSHHVEE